jgi:uncharacterized 2Fe-2S/4Fe-4S cluster protein (DUF4445 family)
MDTSGAAIAVGSSDSAVRLIDIATKSVVATVNLSCPLTYQHLLTLFDSLQLTMTAYKQWLLTMSAASFSALELMIPCEFGRSRDIRRITD